MDKNLTPLLKVMSVLLIVYGVGVAIGSIVFATSLFGESDKQLEWISLAAILIGGIVDIVLGIMALMHQKIGMVYKISIFSWLLIEVFAMNLFSLDGITGWLVLLGLIIIPAIFYLAAYKQNQIDQGK